MEGYVEKVLDAFFSADRDNREIYFTEFKTDITFAWNRDTSGDNGNGGLPFSSFIVPLECIEIIYNPPQNVKVVDIDKGVWHEPSTGIWLCTKYQYNGNYYLETSRKDLFYRYLRRDYYLKFESLYALFSKMQSFLFDPAIVRFIFITFYVAKKNKKYKCV